MIIRNENTERLFTSLFKDLCVVTVYTCLKIYPYKKSVFIFVNSVTYFSMLYHGAVEYEANTLICVCMIVKCASESFFNYFLVEIVGSIFLSFLIKISKNFLCSHWRQS